MRKRKGTNDAGIVTSGGGDRGHVHNLKTPLTKFSTAAVLLSAMKVRNSTS